VTAVVAEESIGVALLIGDEEVEVAVGVEVPPEPADSFSRVVDA
jgi:hypothetical protein